MSALGLSPFRRLADVGPLVARVIVGLVMLAHGYQKVTNGPAQFGERALAGLGVPAPVFMGYVVTYTELIGGALLILGLLSRLAAIALTIDLVFAILLVKLDVGLIAARGSGGTGMELDLALIAGFLVVLFVGPGALSLDRGLGIEPEPVAAEPSVPAAAARE